MSDDNFDQTQPRRIPPPPGSYQNPYPGDSYSDPGYPYGSAPGWSGQLPYPPVPPPYPPGPPDHRQRNIALIAAAVVVAALLGGGVAFALTRSSGSHSNADQSSPPAVVIAPVATSAPAVSTASPTPASTTAISTTAVATTVHTVKPAPTIDPQVLAAARSVDGYFTSSATARGLLAGAIADVANCRGTEVDVDNISSAATIRQNLVNQLNSFDFSLLPNGASLVADLRSAWTNSASADSDYQSWAENNMGCYGTAPTTTDEFWADAQVYDQQSTAAKESAVALWNPLAARYHLLSRSAGSF